MTLRHYIGVQVLFLGVVVAGCVDRAGREMVGESGEAAEEMTIEMTDRVELPQEALEALRLTYAVVEERELSPSVQVPAEVVAVPDRRATVGPRVAGRVADVRVNVGDQVRRGDVLAVLESENVGRAWADLIAATARQSVAQRTFDRQQRLLQDRVTSLRAVEEAEGALLVAEADLEAARTRLATFGVEASEEPPENPARVTLTSPLTGTVVARWAHVGQFAEPAETLAEVVNLDELRVEASVYERDMRLIRTGQLVQVEEVLQRIRAAGAAALDRRIDPVGGHRARQRRPPGGAGSRPGRPRPAARRRA